MKFVYELPLYKKLRDAYVLIQEDNFFLHWQPKSDMKVRMLESVRKELVRFEQQFAEELSDNGDQVSD
jgi:hypothetical protein